MEFHPPIESRSTAELLDISSDGVNWVPEARALARVELGRRGIAEERIKDGEQAFTKAVVADHELRERNAKESYTPLELLGIFFIAPILMLGKLFAMTMYFEIKLGLTDLDRDNYKRKYRQRMTLFVVWFVLLLVVVASL
jgi:hypothetical protein